MICLTENSHISGKFSYNISASASEIIRPIFRQIIINSEIAREMAGEIQLINPTTSPQYTGFFCMYAKSRCQSTTKAHGIQIRDNQLYDLCLITTRSRNPNLEAIISLILFQRFPIKFAQVRIATSSSRLKGRKS
jgi:hypothetical protein